MNAALLLGPDAVHKVSSCQYLRSGLYSFRRSSCLSRRIRYRSVCWFVDRDYMTEFDIVIDQLTSARHSWSFSSRCAYGRSCP